MTKVYLDTCCYNRPFDELKQERIKAEVDAIKEILKKYLNKELEIYRSLALDFEISMIKNINKRGQVEDLYDGMELIEIIYSEDIKRKAIELKKYNIKEMDALHLSFAENNEVDYFITTDRMLIKASNRANLNIKVIDPVKFIMEVI